MGRGGPQLTPTATIPCAGGGPRARTPPRPARRRPSSPRHDTGTTARPSRPTPRADRAGPPPRGWSGSSRTRGGPRRPREAPRSEARWDVPQDGSPRVVVAGVLGAVGEHRPEQPDRPGHEQSVGGRERSGGLLREPIASSLRELDAPSDRLEGVARSSPAAANLGSSPDSLPWSRPGLRRGNSRGGHPRSRPGRSSAGVPTRAGRIGRGRASSRSRARRRDDHRIARPDHGRWRPMTTIVMSSAAGAVPRNSATASRSAATMSCADPRRAASIVVSRRGSPNRSPDGPTRVGHPIRVQQHKAVAGPEPDVQLGRAGTEKAPRSTRRPRGVDRSAVGPAR